MHPTQSSMPPQASSAQIGSQAQQNGPPVLANGVSPAPGSNAPRRRPSSPPSGDNSASAVIAPPHQQQREPPAPLEMPQSPVEQVIVSPADRFGLVGLLHLIKNANTAQQLLSMGSDLSKLGLDIGRRECAGHLVHEASRR